MARRGWRLGSLMSRSPWLCGLCDREKRERAVGGGRIFVSGLQRAQDYLQDWDS
jgi:hypothetical protein